MSLKPTLKDLINTLPQHGELRWIGIRPDKGHDMLEPDSALLNNHSGLEGDRYKGRSGSRHVTLVQLEHLSAIGGMLQTPAVDAAQLRRNLAVSGLNLIALKGKRFTIGNTVLEYTGLCHPCSRMEEIFGPGGYNAVRGHGGITAKVIVGGEICIGDPVTALAAQD